MFSGLQLEFWVKLLTSGSAREGNSSHTTLINLI